MFSVFEERPWFLPCAIPLTVLYTSSFIFSDVLQLVALVPANTLITHTYTWNLVTSCFVESSLTKVIIDLAGLWSLTGVIGKPNIEQFGIYLSFSILAATIGTSIICFFKFVMLGIENPLVVPLYGFCGIQVSLAMYARHCSKSQKLCAFLPQLNFHHLPILIIIVLLALRIIGLRSLTEDILFSFVALLFSWSYLRFYYKFDDNDALGDNADDFTFVGMFPDAFHIVLVPFTTAFYNVMALIAIFPPLETQDRKPHHHLRFIPPVQTPEQSPVVTPVTMKQDMITERRRAKAMKILDAKLAELSKDPETWEENNDIPVDDATETANRFKV